MLFQGRTGLHRRVLSRLHRMEGCSRMISQIKNPWVRKPLVIIAAPFFFALDLVVGLLQSAHETCIAWHGITKRSWRGRA